MHSLRGIFTLSAFLLLAINSQSQLQHPESVKTAQTDSYFGTTVADPYRWLENTNSAATEDWVQRQNAFTQDYLSSIPFKNQVHKKLETLFSYTRYEKPTRQGDYYYYYSSEGMQDQPILYRQKGLEGSPEVFLDPNKLSDDGTTALSQLSFSASGKYCAYTLNKKGSDWSESYVKDVSSKAVLNDHLEWLKFSGLAWYKDDGFYYSRYPQPKPGDTLSGKNQYHSLYYHKIGTTQESDKLVYADSAHPSRYHFAKVTPDNGLLIMYAMEGTEGVQIMMKQLDSKIDRPFKMILEGFEHDAEVIDNSNKYLYLRTNVSAPNYRVVESEIVNPFVNNYETIIPESKDLLQQIVRVGDGWFATYLHDAKSRLVHLTTGGYKLNDIEVPAATTVQMYEGKTDDRDFFYSYQSFTQPTVLCRYDIRKQKSSIFKNPVLPFDPNLYETKEVNFRNRDGLQVPLFMLFKKGTVLNANNPLLLHAYGGFSVAETPVFKPANLAFVDQGGIYVQAIVRGGSEFGDKWHKMGMQFGKQNVFNDFIDAAQYLIKEGYTSSQKLAIHGWSNGGLLVGAVITQKPELFKVALPESAVLDMLRYQKFTVGAGWIPEYGSSDDMQHFDNLYSYSPLQNIKPGRSYPATFVTAADHDDRVVPLHSYKFTARLQECQAGENPILIRVEKGAGHEEGKPVNKLVDEWSDVLSFTFYNLGMNVR